MLVNTHFRRGGYDTLDKKYVVDINNMNDVYSRPCKYIGSLHILTVILLAIVYGLRQWSAVALPSGDGPMILMCVLSFVVALLLAMRLIVLSILWFERFWNKMDDEADSDASDANVGFGLYAIMLTDLFLLLPIALLAIARPGRIVWPTFLSMVFIILIRYSILSRCLACKKRPSPPVLKAMLNISTGVSIVLIIISAIDYVIKRMGEYGVTWDNGDTVSMVFTVLPLIIWGGMVRL